MTKAETDRFKLQLTKQAQALADTLVAMNKAVLDNASLANELRTIVTSAQ